MTLPPLLLTLSYSRSLVKLSTDMRVSASKCGPLAYDHASCHAPIFTPYKGHYWYDAPSASNEKNKVIRGHADSTCSRRGSRIHQKHSIAKYGSIAGPKIMAYTL